MAGTAVRGRLNTWQTATVGAASEETFRVRTLRLEVPGWPGADAGAGVGDGVGAARHRAGQHVDVRLTAEDGYQAERAYSIASAPGEPLAITVERLDDGEVSPYLTQEARPGDLMEIRGPIGGYFGWEPAFGGPLLLAAGGSGIVPLRAMLRARSRAGSDVPVRLLYSSRSWEDVIYASELDFPDEGVQVIHTLTRSQPPAWAGYARRVDRQMLAEVAWPASSAGSAGPAGRGPAGRGSAGRGDGPLAYVCGPTSFVETVAAGLVSLGYPAGRVRTERFGAGGQ
jgi:ferredoxin-NADP reductase